MLVKKVSLDHFEPKNAISLGNWKKNRMQGPETESRSKFSTGWLCCN